MTSIPDHIRQYYQQKCRDLPYTPDPVSDLLQALDIATTEMLNLDGSPVKVKQAFEAVLRHPLSTWSEETLNYRQRQLHYK
jgi:hypothetical protein